MILYTKIMSYKINTVHNNICIIYYNYEESTCQNNYYSEIVCTQVAITKVTERSDSECQTSSTMNHRLCHDCSTNNTTLSVSFSPA